MPETIFIISEEDYNRDQERLKDLEKKVAFLTEALQQNGDQLPAPEAKRLTGMKDNRTLKKHFTPVEVNGKYYYSRMEILQWRNDQGLHKAPHLTINKAA